MFKKEIFYSDDGKPNFTIYTLFKIGKWSLCLHIFSPDYADQDYHDHAFNFWSLIIKGSYVDLFSDGKDPIRLLFSIAYRPYTHKHKVAVTSKSSCITLCLKQATGHSWGFYIEDKFIPWREYLASKNYRKS